MGNPLLARLLPAIAKELEDGAAIRFRREHGREPSEIELRREAHAIAAETFTHLPDALSRHLLARAYPPEEAA